MNFKTVKAIAGPASVIIGSGLLALAIIVAADKFVVAADKFGSHLESGADKLGDHIKMGLKDGLESHMAAEGAGKDLHLNDMQVFSTAMRESKPWITFFGW
ncbi:hypothetical protein GPECTOR_2g1342 [Gonium pectorale]|uniref:Uncharacterized protein n=1 Tax=Gonium pectorale TaxID=33097 RepID=A0A150H1E1_GONPE|nr:hypothetical protein GPECTOR_2g1342 [Gonium pectorale]|eukprot:KXZ55792.1 hypothetical protein GPECTOR_2g1342 [Gonium pectorale]